MSQIKKKASCVFANLITVKKTGLVFIVVLLLSGCNNHRPVDQTDKKNGAGNPEPKLLSQPEVTTDTLQFIHFEGNFDYWSCVFLDSKKDTVTLVTDTILPSKLKNRLFEVKSFMDTLLQAGDNDSKFSARRMSEFRLLKGKPFVAPITEKQILRDIWDIPEVMSGADQAAIAERPTDEKNYYLVETGTHGEDNFSRFYMFRVYIYPNYEIRVYDPDKDADMSLEQWRKQNQ